MNKDQKIVCVCRKGQVRSVAVRHILAEEYGFKKVLACGWERNDADTLNMLYQWADIIIVVGRPHQWPDVPGAWFHNKTLRLEVGADVFGYYLHPLLIERVRQLLEPLITK